MAETDTTICDIKSTRNGSCETIEECISLVNEKLSNEYRKCNELDETEIIEQLKKLGYDVDSLTIIDAIIKILSARTLDKKASIGDMMKFVEMFAKYTGQEPAQEINLGVNIEVADKKTKDEIEDLWND